MPLPQVYFTLIELIVVIAILGILAAIDIPRFTGLRVSSAVKADSATAAQIINETKIQEAETSVPVTDATGAELHVTLIDSKYMIVPDHPQTGADGKFRLLRDATSGAYYVTFTPDASYAPYKRLQTVTDTSK